MKKTLIITSCLLFNAFAFAQSNEATITLKSRKVDYDTSRIESHYDKLAFHVFTIKKFRNFELKSTEFEEKMNFEPNGQTNLGLGFNYKWIGIGMAFSLPFMNKDNDVYGKTSRFDLQLNLFARSYGISAYFQNYKGFYVANPEEFSTNTFETYPYLEDLQSFSLGIEGFYFFNNKKFSYKAAFIRNEVQKKSAGGFILGGFYKLSAISAPSGFIPAELPDSLNQFFNINGYVTSSFGVSVGYAYTLKLFKRAFLNLSAVPGVGIRNLRISKTNGDEETVRDGTGNFTARVSLGYEGKRFYWGAASIISVESFKYESIEISASTGYAKFYLGKRFDLTKKKKKKVNPEFP